MYRCFVFSFSISKRVFLLPVEKFLVFMATQNSTAEVHLFIYQDSRASDECCFPATGLTTALKTFPIPENTHPPLSSVSLQRFVSILIKKNRGLLKVLPNVLIADVKPTALSAVFSQAEVQDLLLHANACILSH